MFTDKNTVNLKHKPTMFGHGKTDNVRHGKTDNFRARKNRPFSGTKKLLSFGLINRNIEPNEICRKGLGISLRMNLIDESL